MPGRDSRITQTIHIPVRDCGWARRSAGSIAKTAKAGTHIDIRRREENVQMNGTWMAKVVISSWRSDAVGYAVGKLKEGDPSRAPKRPSSRRPTKAPVARPSFAVLDDGSDDEADDVVPKVSEADALAAAEKAAGLVRAKSERVSDADKALEDGWKTVGAEKATTKKTKKGKKKGKGDSYTLVGGAGIGGAKKNDETRMKGILTKYYLNKAKYDKMAEDRLKNGSWRPKHKGQKPEGLYSCFYEWKDQGGVRYGQLKYFSRTFTEKVALSTSHEDTDDAPAAPTMDIATDSFPTLGGKVLEPKKVTWGVVASAAEKTAVTSTVPTTDAWGEEGDTVGNMVILGAGGASTEATVAPKLTKPLPRSMLSVAGQFDADAESSFVDEDDDWESAWDNGGMVAGTA